MKDLILHPTDVSQWYALVNEAQASTHVALGESIESYLVFLLQRFIHTPQLAESIIALDFLESISSPSRQQIEKLRVVGDKSLLLCGLFPGITAKRNISVDYYAGMGQSAYLSVSELGKKPESDLYLELSANFINLKNILQAMRCDFQQSKFSSSTIIAIDDKAHNTH
jgi:hypothetical protein